MRYLFYLLSFFFISNTCFGATLYVDGGSGSDSNNGTTVGSAFLTIGQAIATALPGDSILIKGGIYKEHIKRYSGGGTPGNQITIKNYDANEVILDGSLTNNGWTVDTGTIYKTTPSGIVSTVVIDNTPLKPAVTQTNSAAYYTDTTTRAKVTISQGQFYQDNSTGILYVWTPNGDSPSAHTVGIVRVPSVMDSTYDGIYLWDAGYFTFENLTIRFYGTKGISAAGASSHNIYKNLKIKFNWSTGISTGPNAQLLGCEIGWDFIANWPRGKYNGGTQGGGWGAGVNLGADSLAQGNTIYKNGGEGMLTYMNTGNSVLKGNTVYDNWSMNLYVDTAPNVILENNLVYCTNPNLTDDDNNAFPNDVTVIKGLWPIGIGTADEYYGGEHTNYLHDVTIRNNIIINCRRGYNHYPQYVGSGMININLLNNTIITPSTVASWSSTAGDSENFTGILLNNVWSANSGNIIKNNIVISRNARNYALYYQTSETNPFATYSMSNNLWYNTNSATPIHWGTSYTSQDDRTLAQWKALPGSTHGQGDLSADPIFAGVGDVFSSSYYYPSPTSPNIGAGVTLQGFSTDFAQRTRPTSWAIGALELGSLAPTAVPNINSIRLN